MIITFRYMLYRKVFHAYVGRAHSNHAAVQYERKVQGKGKLSQSFWELNTRHNAGVSKMYSEFNAALAAETYYVR